jgi:predicted transposase YbfD/YdcC
MQTIAKLSLVEHFKDLPDPRVNRTKAHQLIDILVVAICSLLCGGKTFQDMATFGQAKEAWLKTFLSLTNGIPSHDTFNRVFAALDPKAFGECFIRWTESLREAIDKEIVAVDGKALRRALNKKESLTYIVSAWAAGNRLVLGQVKVADKSNEITAVPELLRMLELSGCIVTIDAMGCQKKIAKEIVEADADYVLALKGNQETVHEEVKSFLDALLLEREARLLPGQKLSPAAAQLAACETVEKDHGRLEIRRYYQSDALDWFADRKDWEKLTSVGLVESIREINGQATVERRYFLSSLSLGVERFGRAARGHWGVENDLHWCLDVCFDEDQSRARAGNSAANLALLRRLALNTLKKEKTHKGGLEGKQFRAALDPSYLVKLLGITPEI